MSKQATWNCSYINEPHTWIVDANQEDTGSAGVRVHCSNCPQVDTLLLPYSHALLTQQRETVGNVINGVQSHE